MEQAGGRLSLQWEVYGCLPSWFHIHRMWGVRQQLLLMYTNFLSMCIVYCVYVVHPVWRGWGQVKLIEEKNLTKLNNTYSIVSHNIMYVHYYEQWVHVICCWQCMEQIDFMSVVYNNNSIICMTCVLFEFWFSCVYFPEALRLSITVIACSRINTASLFTASSADFHQQWNRASTVVPVDFDIARWFP